jgi:hypothetical protein
MDWAIKRFGLLVIVLLSYISSGAQTPDTVKVGVYVISIHDINFHDKEYTIRFWLWFVYKPNPNFDFTTQLDIPNAKEIDPVEPEEIITSTVKGKTWVQLKMKCIMKENWKVHDFPFDKQRLHIHVENMVNDITKLVFVADPDSKYNKAEATDGWRIGEFIVSSDTNRYDSGFGDPEGHKSQTYSNFKVEMGLERNTLGLFMKIFIGMYIAFLISLISFFSSPWETDPRFGLPVGGLFAAVGNKYIIDSLLPESSQFTLVDTLHSLTFFGILSVLVVSAIAMKYYDHDNKVKCLQVDWWGSRILVVVYIAANLFFIFTT